MKSILKSMLNIALDIGYNSVGWAVYLKASGDSLFPTFLGAGVLLFDEGSCLGKNRSAKRRIRKQILARKKRIMRIRQILLDMDVMTPEELDNFKCASPWFLAAKVLTSKGDFKLTWPEFWSVLRYYAHNRGYDGNAAWARTQEDEEEVAEEQKRLQASEKMLRDFGVESSAECICKFLGISLEEGAKRSSRKYFKGENVIFNRARIEREVGRIIDAHIDVLPKCDQNFKELIMGNWRNANSCISLPQRFSSNKGLLFGQYIPRFDNRIIAKCPITGKKVPVCHSYAFLDFRWKMLLSNIRMANGMSLSAEQLTQLDEQMRLYGKLTRTTFKKVLLKVLGDIPPNTEGMFLTEEMAEALLLDPVKAEILKHLSPDIGRNLPNDEQVKKLWELFPKFVLTRMFHLKEYSLKEIAHLLEGEKKEAFLLIVKSIYESGHQTKLIDAILEKKMQIRKLPGRAAYARKILLAAAKEIMEGKDPRGEGNALYLKAEQAQANLMLPIDSWTNNQLVRHRLKMLQRLYGDIVRHFAGGDFSAVESVTAEVVKDLSRYSGMTIKERAMELGQLVKQHKAIVKNLAEKGLPLSAGLIRKAKIADDMNYTCPYTGKKYSLADLRNEDEFDKEHIIPRSLRPSDSLDSLVLTWKAVNQMKGARTGYQFVKECQGQSVQGMPNLTIVSLENYKKFVENLRPSKTCAFSLNNSRRKTDDEKRVERRKRLLLIEFYDKRKSGFLPSDLTQTSHLNKLAFRALQQLYINREQRPKFLHIPGSATAAIRKNWDLIPCIGASCPEIFIETQEQRRICKTKGEIREITHLHHAVDAIAMGLSSAVFPNTERFYTLLSKRRMNESEKRELGSQRALFRFNQDGNWTLIDLGKEYLAHIQKILSESKVIKHMPHSLSGLSVEETLWRVVGTLPDGKVKIRQLKSLKGKPLAVGDKRREKKEEETSPSKLLGYLPESTQETKLSRTKSAFIIKENFGVALSNPPKVLRYIKVWKQLEELTAQNGGKRPEVLRRNQLIQIERGRYKGIWRVASVKEGQKIKLDIINPFYINVKKYAKREIRLNSLIDGGLKILKTDFVG